MNRQVGPLIRLDDGRLVGWGTDPSREYEVGADLEAFLTVAMYRGDGLEWRFLARPLQGDNGCWLWARYRDGSVLPPGTYGQFYTGGRPWPAHGWARERWVEEWKFYEPQTLHSCDETRCVNPAHLSAGDAQGNAADRSARLRYRGGLCAPGYR